MLAALGDADGDPELSDALDRWELSLFQNEPFRGEQLRAAMTSLLGDTWPMRCCVLLGEDAKAREELYGELTVLASGDAATSAAVDAVRRAVVAVLRSRDRDRLVHDLDRELLGLDRRPAPHAIAVGRDSRLGYDPARSRYPSASAARATVVSMDESHGDPRAARADRGARSRGCHGRRTSSTSCARCSSRRRRGRERREVTQEREAVEELRAALARDMIGG